MSSNKTPTFYDIDIDEDGHPQSEGIEGHQTSEEELPPKVLKLKELAKSLQEHRIDPQEKSVAALPKKQNQLAVKIENVAFFYKKNKPILKNITLYVPEGKCKSVYKGHTDVS